MSVLSAAKISCANYAGWRQTRGFIFIQHRPDWMSHCCLTNKSPTAIRIDGQSLEARFWWNAHYDLSLLRCTKSRNRLLRKRCLFLEEMKTRVRALFWLISSARGRTRRG